MTEKLKEKRIQLQILMSLTENRAIKIFRIVSVHLEAIRRHPVTQFQAFKNSWAQRPIGKNF